MRNNLTALYERVEPVAVNPLREEFLAMVDADGAAVMAILKRLCRNPHDAEDVFQEAAVRVWRHFAKRPLLLNPRAWLIKIAYRAFLDHNARKRHHESYVESLDHRETGPAAQTEHADQLHHLHALVEELPDEVRLVTPDCSSGRRRTQRWRRSNQPWRWRCGKCEREITSVNANGAAHVSDSRVPRFFIGSAI